MTETVEVLFDQGLERYNAGESIESLLPVFKEVCDRALRVALPGLVYPGFICWTANQRQL